MCGNRVMENPVAYEEFCEAQPRCLWEVCRNGGNAFTVLYDRSTAAYVSVHGPFCSNNCAIYYQSNLSDDV